MPDRERFPWDGLDDPNGTIVPDAVLDYLMPQLTGAELKVLLYIIRRTFGWKKDHDRISLAQLTDGITRRDGTVVDRGTGLSKNSVIAALKALVELGIVVAEHNTSPQHGHEPTTYALRFKHAPLVQKSDKGSAEIGTPLVQPLHPQPTTSQTTTSKARPSSRASRNPADYFRERRR